MKAAMPGICGVYLFGSVARGDIDSASDTDVLIVYEGNILEAVKAHAKSCVTATLSVECSFAEYSRRRLAEMFAQGHLFAWHLFYEAKTLDVPGLSIIAPMTFARPLPYKSAFTDANNFAGLLRSTLEHLNYSSSSLVYEAGIGYVALRNIAMSLSAALLPQPIFTRWAPFAVASALRSTPPCTDDVYERLVAARHASQRGRLAPRLYRTTLLQQLQYAYTWATSSIEIARGRVTV